MVGRGWRETKLYCTRHCINVSAMTALITIQMNEVTLVVFIQNNDIEQCTSQVMVTRDWAVTLARRRAPGRVLIFGAVAITAASIALRLAFVRP